MPSTYDLSRLDPATFQHLVNLLIMRVLGQGATGFAPGPDGGRDAFFEGEAPYPSSASHWTGVWYVQSKFHAPHLSSNHNRWLMDQVKSELEKFTNKSKTRRQPDNYILATNVDPTGVAETGTFDQAQQLVKDSGLKFHDRFHIWGGQKILDLLTLYPDVASYYFDVLTPGQALAAIRDGVLEDRATFDNILRYLVVTTFRDQQYLKLEQAGSASDTRPGIESLFVDLPFATPDLRITGMVEQTLAEATAQNHRIAFANKVPRGWEDWSRAPGRSRIWFIKGGPGRGKSTLTQFLCQVHRAKLILDNSLPIVPAVSAAVANIQAKASSLALWPLEPRIPIVIELRSFAQWLNDESVSTESTTILSYLASTIGKRLGITVAPGTLLKAFCAGRWLFVFDGLDEVPGDVKQIVGETVTHFIDDTLVGQNCDAFSICTSRPQGYSGQFASLGPTNVDLVDLTPEQALNCAAPILAIDRSPDESAQSLQILQDSIGSPAIRSIMTTPLQSHIMAVVVRDGGKPPERKWQLFSNFYNVIRKREANKTHGDPNLARLLREGDQLIKALHNRLGFELHARAETSRGAQTSLNRDRLRELVDETVRLLLDQNVEETIETLMNATVDRLVLVNTPESGDEVRFDIRPLQEFFAAEYLYESTPVEVLQQRLRISGPDSHWREVIHFLLSGIVENNRVSEISIAVSTLSEINEQTERSDARMLNRRLAIGSLITSRLLGESVLEQDKRVRAQFREPVRALLGSTDAIIYFSEPLGTNSASWLKELVVQHLYEHSEAEAIGAASIIAFEIADDDDRLKQIMKYLRGASPEFYSTLIDIVNQNSIRVHFPDDDLDTNKLPKDWFATWCLEVLLSDDWYKIGRLGIVGALEIVRDAEMSTNEMLRSLGLDIKLAPIFDQIFGDDFNSDYSQNHTLFTRVVGGYRAEYIRLDPDTTYRAWTEDDWKALSETKGFFHLLHSIFDLAVHRTPDHLLKVKREMSRCPDLMQSQHIISRLLPKGIADIDAPSAETINSYYENHAFIRLRSLQPLQPSSTELPDSIWDELVVHETAIAVDLLLRPLAHAHPPGDAKATLSPDNRNELLSRFTADPGLLFANANRLPEIFSIDQRIRSLLKVDSAWCLSAELRLFEDKYQAFHVELPAEANYLPHLVNLLSVATFVRHSNRMRYIRSQFYRDINISEFVLTSIPQPDILLFLLENEQVSSIVRASSAALYLRHPNSNTDKRNFCTQFFGNVDDCPSDWLLRAAAFALDQDVQKFKPEALLVVDKLLKENMNDLKARSALEPVLRSWREASWAAVTSSIKAGTWK